MCYSASKAGHVCKVCEMFCPLLVHNETHNSFANRVQLGTHLTRKLIGRSKCKTHIRACEIEAQARSRNLPQVHSMLLNAANRQGTDEIKRNREYVKVVIRTVFFVVQKRWSLDSVSDLMDHMTSVGNHVTKEYLQYHPDLKYTSSQSVSEIIKCVNHVLQSDILENLRAADMFTLLADESSDESHREQFAIIVRFKHENVVQDYFLGIVEVKRTDAASIMAGIEDFLRLKGVDITKAVFVGFDGCNTMSGENKGENYPDIIAKISMCEFIINALSLL